MSDLPTLGEVCEMCGQSSNRNTRKRMARRLRKLGFRLGIDLLIWDGSGSPVRVRWDDAREHILHRRTAVDALSGPEWDKLFEVVTPIAAAAADQRIDTRVIPRLQRLEAGQETTAKALRQTAERLAEVAKSVPSVPADRH